MAERKPFKPSEITDLKFPFERHDGTRADFDPWDFLAAVEATPKEGSVAMCDSIRQFTGYPTSKELAEIPDGQEKPKTLSLGVCQDLQAAVMEFLAELPSTKKKLQVSQKLSPTG